MSVTLEAIATKVRSTRPVYNLKGERICLTSQQRSIIQYLCRDGLRLKQIAHELGEPFNALKHMAAALTKLSGCSSQAQLGMWAAKQGLV